MQWDKKKWQPGMQVRLINNPLRIGMLTEEEPQERNGRLLFQVRFPTVSTEYMRTNLNHNPKNG